MAEAGTDFGDISELDLVGGFEEDMETSQLYAYSNYIIMVSCIKVLDMINGYQHGYLTVYTIL